MKTKLNLLCTVLIFMLLFIPVTGCGETGVIVETLAGGMETIEPTEMRLPVDSAPEELNASTVLPTSSQEPINVWVEEMVTDALIDGIRLPEGVNRVNEKEDANVIVRVYRAGNEPWQLVESVDWVYVLTAPFFTVQDGIAFTDLINGWQGKGIEGKHILVSAQTAAIMQYLLGVAGDGVTEVVDENAIVETMWNEREVWGIVPFEGLEPRLKVIAIDGQTPVAKTFSPVNYGLTVRYEIRVAPEVQDTWVRLTNGQAVLPSGNWDASKMTTVILTGVTALVRATAAKMDENGSEYPGRDIREWLMEADITHISNEVSFAPDCPPGNPFTGSLMFCSRPEYIDLFTYVGADVIELTGNHMNDWGRKNLLFSLDLYRKTGLPYFASGEEIKAARKPVRFEINGNKIAFIGCNAPGPDYAWATETLAGTAACEDFTWIQNKIRSLTEEGYVVIATMQYNEGYSYTPLPYMERDFRKLAEAGAAIVFGSQAHFAMIKEFRDNAYIDYGAGNLFFDQMDIPVWGTRREFINQHVIYGGRHISTVLLTAMLEDYARPRPMTDIERTEFLQAVFSAAGW